jgi:predicted nucleic acid-binding protein
VLELKFVDSNVLAYYIFKSEYTEKAAQLLIEHEDLATSLRVIDEVMFLSIRKLALERLGLRRLDKVKAYISKHGLDFVYDKFRLLKDVIEKLNIVIIRDYATFDELLYTMTKYHLTPSDAIIALTCKHYGIDTILTFDEDFKRVPWLKVIP